VYVVSLWCSFISLQPLLSKYYLEDQCEIFHQKTFSFMSKPLFCLNQGHPSFSFQVQSKRLNLSLEITWECGQMHLCFYLFSCSVFSDLVRPWSHLVNSKNECV
jgi:hypothetical protein